MGSVDEQILRAAKEIVVKFIEVGRVSPNSFHDAFREIYETVHNAVKGSEDITDKDRNPKKD
ncbi:MAG: conjugal transfer protein TraB [Proteobacteria bacterium]|nr:conjugal transfer protein TraB [Pseudomonadota bacterium]